MDFRKKGAGFDPASVTRGSIYKIHAHEGFIIPSLEPVMFEIHNCSQKLQSS